MFSEIKTYGKLVVQGKEFWLVYPFPIKTMPRTRTKIYFAVPMLSQLTEQESFDYQGKIIYPYPRYVVISGDHYLEYLHGLKIKVKSDSKQKIADILSDLRRAKLIRSLG